MSLIEIQKRLKVPKNQFNAFGKYNYRSCEDILEAVKPLLYEFQYYLIQSDEVVNIGLRYYVKATVALMQDKDDHPDRRIVAVATAYAREEDEKKGMAASQITGAASSYARKYALNGLFAIDDNKDADHTNKHDGNGIPVAELEDLIESAEYDSANLKKPLVEFSEIEKKKFYNKLQDIIASKLSQQHEYYYSRRKAYAVNE